MARLIFSMLVSLDGYVNGPDGKFGWAAPDLEVHAFANAEEAKHGTVIYGRRMYETMVYWETGDQRPDASQTEIDFARIWQGHDKIVVSKSLPEVTSERTTLVREYRADDVRALKCNASTDIAISGPTIGSSLLAQGLVDEVSLYYVPLPAGARRCSRVSMRRWRSTRPRRAPLPTALLLSALRYATRRHRAA